MTDKEKIIIDGVDVSQCEFYIYYSSDRYPHRCGIHKDMFGMPTCCDVADCCKDCYFKQLARKTQEYEELRKELALYKTWYRAKHDDIRNLLGSYRKALEEIEEYTREQFCDNCEDIGSTEYSCHCEYCEYQEYLDIINKAKEK